MGAKSELIETDPGKRTGVSRQTLSYRQLRRPGDAELDAEGLEAIRIAVAEKLKRDHHQSEAFALEAAEEMPDQAYIEYAEKSDEERAQITSLIGWLITTAVRRAIDRARREGRELYGEGAQFLVDTAEDSAPSTVALAARGIEIEKVHAAVAELPTEQRRALALAYWEELPTRKAAKAMGLSTMTFCRRRDAAMDRLRAIFGVKPDDPVDAALRREAGFSAWAIMVVAGGAVHELL